jgi:ribosomal protein S8
VGKRCEADRAIPNFKWLKRHGYIEDMSERERDPSSRWGRTWIELQSQLAQGR